MVLNSESKITLLYLKTGTRFYGSYPKLRQAPGVRGVFVQAELTVAHGKANYDSNGGKVFREWKCLIGFEGGDREEEVICVASQAPKKWTGCSNTAWAP